MDDNTTPYIEPSTRDTRVDDITTPYTTEAPITSAGNVEITYTPGPEEELASK